MRRLALAFSLVLAACTSGPSGGGGSGPSASFVADEPPGGAAVFLRSQGGDRSLKLDVVARGAPQLHGAALRITFDPDALAFAGAEASSVWTHRSMALAKEGTPGQIAIAWFAKGGRGVEADGETVLGTLSFDVKARKESAIAFKVERSSLVTPEGKAIDVSFRGGRLR